MRKLSRIVERGFCQRSEVPHLRAVRARVPGSHGEFAEEWSVERVSDGQIPREQTCKLFTDNAVRPSGALPTFSRDVPRLMKTDDYRAILHAVEQAIVICDQSTGMVDRIHQDICEELRATRARLRLLMGQVERENT